MPDTPKEVYIRLWRLLKQPFTLPTNYTHTHTCDWKAIDVDLLGCVICGQIHACADLQCKNIIETEDGTVCALSGVYIRNKQYVLTEYQDTVNLTDMKVSHRVIEESSYEDILSVYQRLILSQTAENLHYKQQLNCVLKCHQHFKRSHDNGVLWCLRVVSEINDQMHIFDRGERQAVIDVASKNCYNVLSVLVAEFGMYMKANELQEMAVGLLYLMRTGIRHSDSIVLPALPQLRHMLPAENLLGTHFGIRSKYITESENRTKLCLRHAKPEKLASVVFCHATT